MKIQSLKAIHWVAIIIAVFATTYTIFYFNKADAGYVFPISTIAVQNFIPNPENGLEAFTLNFTGFLNQEVAADLTGWTLKSNSGFSLPLSEVVLTSSEDIRVCNSVGSEPYCNLIIPKENLFLDEGDSLIIIRKDGSEAVRIDYDAPTEVLRLNSKENNNYSVYVNTPGDKIGICEMQPNGTLKASNSNVQKLTQDVTADTTLSEDIIPPFVYERNKQKAYFKGVNWPEGQTTLTNGCK